VESESQRVRVWARSRRLSFEGDSSSRPYLFYLELRSSLFDFCVIYFTTRTLFLHDCALLLQEFNIFVESSLSTQSLCHTISETEYDFGPAVGVWSPKFLTLELESHKKQVLRIPD